MQKKKKIEDYETLEQKYPKTFNKELLEHWWQYFKDVKTGRGRYGGLSSDKCPNGFEDYIAKRMVKEIQLVKNVSNLLLY